MQLIWGRTKLHSTDKFKAQATPELWVTDLILPELSLGAFRDIIYPKEGSRMGVLGVQAWADAAHHGEGTGIFPADGSSSWLEC